MNIVLPPQQNQRGYYLYRSAILAILTVVFIAAATESIEMHKPLGIWLSVFLAIGFGAASLRLARKFRDS